MAVTEWVTNQLERVIYGITSNEQKRFKAEFSIHLIELEAWWVTIGIQVHRKTIEQRVIHFGYPKILLLSHIWESIWWMGSVDNFTSDISEQLHITHVKEAYRCSNKVNSIRQMLKHYDWCTGLDYMEETLWYLPLEGCYNIDSEYVFNLLSGADQQRSTCRAHLLHLETIQEEPLNRPVSQQVYLVSATGPGNPPAVQFLAGGLVRFGLLPGQNPEPLCLGWIVTRTEPKPCVFWPGETRTAGRFCGSYNFGSN